MSFKAFVSSTFIDLQEHRSYVIDVLRKAGFFVDPMEDWGAENNEPRVFSQSRVENCDLCILIVGFRRGYIPENGQQSITQLEYEAARKRGIPILVYCLKEDAPWPRKYDELDRDPKMREWRQELQQDHGVGYFGLDKSSINIAPDIARWLAEKSNQSVASGTSTINDREIIACKVLSQTMATVFVDIMRLLYVAAGGVAREADIDRYSKFIEFASLHWSNLESHIARLSLSLNNELIEQSVDLERQLSYMLNELKRGSELLRGHISYFKKMLDIADDLHHFCNVGLGDSYKQMRCDVDEVVEEFLYETDLTKAKKSLDELWRLRLRAQSELLRIGRERDNTSIYTIKDDMKQRSAIQYFAIDHQLLRYIVAF